MLDAVIIKNIVAIIIVCVFIFTLMLPKFWKFFTSGVLLTGLGIMPLLYKVGKLGFNVLDIPIFQYLLIILVILDGRELLVEGFRESNKIIKYLSITLGIFLIIVTTLPVLYDFGAITFNIPNIPETIIYLIYTLAGVLLTIGAFTFSNDNGHI